MLPKSNTILPLPWFKRGKCYANWNFDHCCLPWLPAYIYNEKVTKCWPNLNRDHCGLAYFECVSCCHLIRIISFQAYRGVFCFCFVFVFLYSFCATRFQTLPVSHKVSWPQVLQEMRRSFVQSRLNTCTDMMPPFPVVIVWYFVWLPNKCRHAAIFFFSLFLFFGYRPSFFRCSS